MKKVMYVERERDEHGMYDGISDAMKNLEKDNFREKLAIKENDSIEIQKISEGFNDMTERIYHLIGQVKQLSLIHISEPTRP